MIFFLYKDANIWENLKNNNIDTINNTISNDNNNNTNAEELLDSEDSTDDIHSDQDKEEEY